MIDGLPMGLRAERVDDLRAMDRTAAAVATYQPDWQTADLNLDLETLSDDEFEALIADHGLDPRGWPTDDPVARDPEMAMQYGHDPRAWPTAEQIARDEAIRQRNLARKAAEAEAASHLPDPLDWGELFANDREVDWLVEDLLPAGRQLHLFAKGGGQKSLVTLWVAACLAVGRDPFSGEKREPIVVAYLDYEQTEEDIRDRLSEMEFEPDQLGNFRYYLWPGIDPLDTARGGEALMRLVERDGTALVVIDTLSRVTEGEENSNDTYLAFYRHTGSKLRAAGVSLWRLDHEGKDSAKGARGASAKADDVDVVWRLELRSTDVGDGLRFNRNGQKSRIGYIPTTFDVRKLREPLRFERIGESWPAGTKEKADELDRIGFPLRGGRDAARKALAAAGMKPGTNAILSKALIRRRKEAAKSLEEATEY